jgi:hypothetical protein
MVTTRQRLLLLPDPGIGRYGADSYCAELVLHFDLPMKDGSLAATGLP